MADLLDTKLYALIGEESFARLVAAFYRQVPSDDILGPLYPKHDLTGAQERLREFLIQRFGGPERYSQARGHPRLRMRHAPFTVDQAARDRWLGLMGRALTETKLPAEAEALLRQFFDQASTFLINR